MARQWRRGIGTIAVATAIIVAALAPTTLRWLAV